MHNLNAWNKDFLVLDEAEQKNEAHTVIRTTRVLHANVIECMDATIGGVIQVTNSYFYIFTHYSFKGSSTKKA